MIDPDVFINHETSIDDCLDFPSTFDVLFEVSFCRFSAYAVIDPMFPLNRVQTCHDWLVFSSGHCSADSAEQGLVAVACWVSRSHQPFNIFRPHKGPELMHNLCGHCETTSCRFKSISAPQLLVLCAVAMAWQSIDINRTRLLVNVTEAWQNHAIVKLEMITYEISSI